MKYKYPKIWIVVTPANPTSRHDRYHGPFVSPGAAAEWAEHMNFHVPWTIAPLDTLGIQVGDDVKRTHLVLDVEFHESQSW